MSSIAAELERFQQRKKKSQSVLHHQDYATAEIQVEMDVEMAGIEPDRPDLDISEQDLKVVEEYEGAAQCYGAGTTFMDEFDSDAHGSERVNNLYYPFKSREEWELASFLLHSDLSMASITKFLSLNLVHF